MNVQTRKIKKLIAALRNPMPNGFTWNWYAGYRPISPNRACGCAVGLAIFTGIVKPNSHGVDNIGYVARHLGLDSRRKNNVFVNAEKDGMNPRVIAERLARIVARETSKVGK
jgi:hypothetical protein